MRGGYHEKCKIILTKNDSQTMPSLRFTANKNQQKILENNPSITLLFNLLALHNKLNPKSVLMVCAFFSPQFFFIYIA